MAASAQNRRFGEIAIALGLCRELEVRGALAQQKQPGWEWGTGSILVQQGKITPQQLREILLEQGIRYQPLEPGRRKGHSETRLGKLATERGFISFTELVRGLESQRKAEEATGEQPPLGKVLVDLKILDHDALGELLEDMGVLVCYCHTCHLAFNLVGDPQGRSICCPECHSRYVAPSREHVLSIRGNLHFPRPPLRPARSSSDSRVVAIPVDAIHARPSPTPTQTMRAVPAPEPVTRPDPGVKPGFPLSPEVLETQEILGRLVDSGIISEDTAVHAKRGGLAKPEGPALDGEDILPPRRAPVFPHADVLAGALPGSTADGVVPDDADAGRDGEDGSLGVVAAEKRRPFLETAAPVQRGFYSLYVSEDSETFAIPPDEARLSQSSQEVIIKSSNRPKLNDDDLDSAPLPDEFQDMVRIVEVDGEDGGEGRVITTVITPEEVERRTGKDRSAGTRGSDQPSSRRNPVVPDAIVMSSSPGKPTQHRSRPGSGSFRIPKDGSGTRGPGPLSSPDQTPTGAEQVAPAPGDGTKRPRLIAHSIGSPRQAPVGPPPSDAEADPAAAEDASEDPAADGGLEVFQIIPGGGVIPSGTEYPAGHNDPTRSRKTPHQPPPRMLGAIPPQPSWDVSTSMRRRPPEDHDATPPKVDSGEFPDSDSYSVHEDEG